MDNINSIMKTHYENVKEFTKLLKEKNPDINISIIDSLDLLSKEYLDGLCYKNTPEPIILKVNGDYELPYEKYDEYDLTCTSWRNNGYNGGIPYEENEKMKQQLPLDFDVVKIQGNFTLTNATQTTIFTVGGVAKPMENTLENNNRNR